MDEDDEALPASEVFGDELVYLPCQLLQILELFLEVDLLLGRDLFQKDEHVAQRVQEQAASYGQSVEDFEGEQPISRARNRFFRHPTIATQHPHGFRHSP